VLAALTQARMLAAPMFAKWCELNGLSACPAAPAAVARFVADCAALGIERLWPAVQDISRMHAGLGLADPTLGRVVADAVDRVARVSPPRSWPDDRKLQFKALPYDLQLYVATHEAQRDTAIRRAQNEAADARQRLAALRQKSGVITDDINTQKAESDGSTSRTDARGPRKADSIRD
jgi:hypothetical protein